MLALGFLAPALFLLVVWIVYPTITTMLRSLRDRGGSEWVGFQNYETMLTSDTLVTAIKNNAIWIAAMPATVTAIGLILAVLMEKIRWSVAFKTALFMPLAISALAAGVTWRIMYTQDPERGAVNAAIESIRSVGSTPGVLEQARAGTDDVEGSPETGFTTANSIEPGGAALLSLTAIAPDDLPTEASQAESPDGLAGGVRGVVWRDFKPGGGTPGVVERGELGVPGARVLLVRSDGSTASATSSETDGTFAFEEVPSGSYRVVVSNETFETPWGGVPWLGSKLILPSMMIAYMWVHVGFALVVIAAGLAALPRDVLDAARTEGASEWQILRKITVPLLGPILMVVFIALMIDVLKLFDIVIAIAPGSVQTEASTLALAMWRTSFGGVNDFGVGSAIAVFILVLVLPVLYLNLRQLRRERNG